MPVGGAEGRAARVLSRETHRCLFHSTDSPTFVSQALYKQVATLSRWERASSLSLPTGFFRDNPGVAFPLSLLLPQEF